MNNATQNEVAEPFTVEQLNQLVAEVNSVLSESRETLTECKAILSSLESL
jgi:hypothetical protein